MWFFLFLITCFVGGFPQTSKEVRYDSLECILDICETYFTVAHTLAISKPGLQNDLTTAILERLHQLRKWPLVVSEASVDIPERDPLVFDQTNDDKHESYLVIVCCKEILDLQLRQLHSLSAWNSRGKFVVMIDRQIEDCFNDSDIEIVFEKLWVWKIYNVVVLQVCSATKNATYIDVYTWYPYKIPSGQCGKLLGVVKLDTCIIMDNYIQFSKMRYLFEEKIPNDFQGCEWRASTIKLIPFIIHRNNTIVGGSDIRLIISMAKSMNINLQFSFSPGKEWKGRKLPNGTWNGLRGNVLYGKADIVFGHMIVNLFDHLLLDDTVMYFADEVKWYVARAKLYPRWLGMARVFTPGMWFTLFLSIPLASVVFTLLAKKGRLEFNVLVQKFMDVYAIFLSAGASSLPNSASVRIFILFWVIFSMSVDTVFETFATSYLVNPGLLHQVQTIEELKSYNAVFAFSEVLNSYFSEDYLQYLVPRLNCIPEDCLEYLASHENVATYMLATSVDYFAENLMKDGFTGFYGFSTVQTYTPIALMLPKDSPLLDRVNEILTRFIEGGLPDKYYRDTVVQRRIEVGVGELKNILDDYIPFSTTHLQGALYLHSLGTVLSLFVFMLELIVIKVQNYRRPKRTILMLHKLDNS